MDLKENEEIIVFSAGDVIPQIKLPSVRSNLWNSPDLKISKICPYCNEKLTRINTEYYCTNKNCPRIITGRIANFFIKVGMKGFSDSSIEIIHESLGVSTIHEFLNLTIDDILKVPGFEITSATNFIEEINKIRHSEIPLSKLFGALGIEKISEKKCRKIFEYISLKDLLQAESTQEYLKIFYKLQCSDGIGSKTAEAFLNFVKDNKREILEILKIIRVGGDIKFQYNIVFTGFRPSKDIYERINDLGLEIAESVSKNTLAVITSSTENQSVKSKAAISKGIPIIHVSEMEEYLTELENDYKNN